VWELSYTYTNIHGARGSSARSREKSEVGGKEPDSFVEAICRQVHAVGGLRARQRAATLIGPAVCISRHAVRENNRACKRASSGTLHGEPQGGHKGAALLLAAAGADLQVRRHSEVAQGSG
jgi:hypothetical protein